MLLSLTASENEILFHPRKPSLQLLGFLPGLMEIKVLEKHIKQRHHLMNDLPDASLGTTSGTRSRTCHPPWALPCVCSSDNPTPHRGPILPTRYSPPMRCTGSHTFIITSYVLYISLTNTFPIAYLFPGAAVIDSHKLKCLGSLTGQMSETAPLD